MIYNHDYAFEASRQPANIVELINEGEMFLTHEQLITLLEMAGAKPNDELDTYDYLIQWNRNGYYMIDKYYNTGENIWEIDYENIEKKEGREV